MFNRIGRKNQRIMKYILPYFPYHNVYIDLFFGAGGMFYFKPMVKYNFLNDLDSEVANVFDVLMNHTDELYEYFELAPVHHKLYKDLIKLEPKNDIERAFKFVYLSKYGIYNTLIRFTICKNKETLLNDFKWFLKEFNKKTTYFTSVDFREVLKLGILSKLEHPTKRRFEKYYFPFIYADPPYLSTYNNYNTPKWTKQDALDLLTMCKECKYKFAISEFDNPFIIENANKLGLNIINILDRHQSLSNKKGSPPKKKQELLITNYVKSKEQTILW